MEQMNTAQKCENKTKSKRSRSKTKENHLQMNKNIINSKCMNEIKIMIIIQTLIIDRQRIAKRSCKTGSVS